MELPSEVVDLLHDVADAIDGYVDIDGRSQPNWAMNLAQRIAEILSRATVQS